MLSACEKAVSNSEYCQPLRPTAIDTAVLCLLAGAPAAPVAVAAAIATPAAAAAAVMHAPTRRQAVRTLLPTAR
jgi:hypothetical protein